MLAATQVIQPNLERETSRLVSLLDRVDRVATVSAGAFVFGPDERPVGTILVEGGRICWAISRKMRRRLSDIVRHRSGESVTSRSLEEIYEHCRTTGEPFGQRLVSSRILTAAELRKALEEQMAEAFAGLLDEAAHEPRWVPRLGHPYDAQFTFSSAEVLSFVGELRWGPVAAEAREELHRSLENGGIGVAAIAGGDSPVPLIVAAHAAESLGARGTLELGTVGATMLSHAPGGGSATFATWIRDDRRSAIAWSSSGILYSVLCEEASSFACVIARFCRARPQGDE
jgi:hypothetical protein